MKIENISCDQFAGVRDRNVSLTDGINVIYGKNESGKSTLVNLLSRTLFQKAKLDRRSDKDFFELYFPGANKSGMVGDFVNGKITFETEKGSYTLEKEWGADPRCTLSTPDGRIREQTTIDELLKEQLVYGEGVYSDMLFSSQRNTEDSLEKLLDASKNTDAKQEIVNVASQAFAESGGISIDAIEQAIKDKMIEIVGKGERWNFERGLPERRTGGARWTNGIGEIIKAYYTLEDAKLVLKEISDLESEADRATQEYAEHDLAARNAEETYNQFHSLFSRLELQREHKEKIDRIHADRLKLQSILTEWPKLAEGLEKAKELRTEKTNRELLNQYEAAKEIRDELAAIDAEFANRLCPGDADITQVKTAQRSIASLENKLCGMNLNAAVQMLNNDRIAIVSLRTGEAVELENGVASITEAVKITIPGVMEMQLSPTDVDVAAIESRIEEQKRIVAELFATYQVASLDELEMLKQQIMETQREINSANDRLTMLLGDTTFEALESAAGKIAGPVRSTEEIEGDIIALCGNGDIVSFIAAKAAVLDRYTAEHGSVNDLKAKAFDLDAELKKAKESVQGTEDIPAEYLDIPDPEAHLQDLQRDMKTEQALRDEALAAKIAAASKLESRQETLSGDPTEDVDRAERAFEEQKSLLAHWRHIQEVFKAQKEKIHDNPMQDIADHFARYLAVITDGKVSSEFLEADKLNMEIYSENRLLDYGKLSEGTKETVSLAFRLAVLDHLFPEGGGVIVFDDPFNDMDSDRTAQSCELIKECAKHHQVIFLTCKDEYKDKLDGNFVQI